VKTYQTLEYVSKLNKSLLLLSKIDNSQFVEEDVVSLNELLHRYLDDYREVYAYRNIQVDMEERGCFVWRMNATLAVVLVTNLLRNAFVHNIDDGKVRIEVDDSGVAFCNTGADEALDEFVGECAVKVELVPVLLIHVPGTCDFRMAVAQFYGVIGLALEHEPLRALQVEHRKDAPPDAKGKGGFVEGEVLGGKG
jgi:hypothetical protein